MSEPAARKGSYIIRHRMLTETPQTLEEIGARFEVSRERVRQIEKGV